MQIDFGSRMLNGKFRKLLIILLNKVPTQHNVRSLLNYFTDALQKIKSEELRSWMYLI